MKKCLQVHLVFHHNLPQLKEDSVGLLYVALNGHHLGRLKRIHKFLQADLLVSIRVELMKQFLNCVATHLRNHLSDHSMKLFKAQGTWDLIIISIPERCTLNYVNRSCKLILRWLIMARRFTNTDLELSLTSLKSYSQNKWKNSAALTLHVWLVYTFHPHPNQISWIAL